MTVSFADFSPTLHKTTYNTLLQKEGKNSKIPKYNLSKITPFGNNAFPNMPGISNLLAIPNDMIYTLRNLISGIKQKDKETIVDAGVHLTSVPANAISSLYYMCVYLEQDPLLSHFATSHPILIDLLKFLGPIPGIILCATESLLELNQIFRLRSFKKRFVSIQNNQDLNHLQFYKKLVHEYFSLSSGEQQNLSDQEKETVLLQKYKRLSRRIQPCHVLTIHQKILKINEHLQSEDPKEQELALSEIHEIYNLVKTQTNKTLMLLSIGVASLFTIMLGLSAILASAIVTLPAHGPITIPLFLFTIGTILGCLRFILYKGMIDQKGWQFSISPFIPESIQRWFQPNAIDNEGICREDLIQSFDLKHSQSLSEYLLQKELHASDLMYHFSYFDHFIPNFTDKVYTSITKNPSKHLSYKNRALNVYTSKGKEELIALINRTLYQKIVQMGALERLSLQFFLNQYRNLPLSTLTEDSITLEDWSSILLAFKTLQKSHTKT